MRNTVAQIGQHAFVIVRLHGLLSAPMAGRALALHVPYMQMRWWGTGRCLSDHLRGQQEVVAVSGTHLRLYKQGDLASKLVHLIGFLCQGFCFNLHQNIILLNFISWALEIAVAASAIC